MLKSASFSAFSAKFLILERASNSANPGLVLLKLAISESVWNKLVTSISSASIGFSELPILLAELRELTQRLKTNREGVDQKRNMQVEQLAKIYSAMSPEESAKLMEELDITIALGLMSKMSEKRIGQILSLMDKEKALKMSKMLVNY